MAAHVTSIHVVKEQCYSFFDNIRQVILGRQALRKYRDRSEIIADILTIVSKSAKKTRILSNVNLNFSVLQRYLSELESAQLISFERNLKLFRLEEKGREFLKSYSKYSETLQSTEKRLSDVAAKKKALEELCPKSHS